MKRMQNMYTITYHPSSDQWGFSRWAQPSHFQGTMVCGYSQLPGHWTITRWLDKASPVLFLYPSMVLLLGRAVSF